MNQFMKMAVEQAEIAYKNNEVPIGAVIVKDNRVLASAYNKKNLVNIAICHAEILCIIEASKKNKHWNLSDCDLYVTLKPCNMCMYAIAEARIRNVFYLCDSNYYDNLQSNYDNINMKKVTDVNNSDYEILLKTFFYNLRK